MRVASDLQLRIPVSSRFLAVPQLDVSGGNGGPVTLFASITGAGSSVGAFASFVDSALGQTLSPPFTPYDSNLDFLLGAYILEDVLVTAYEVRAMSSAQKVHLPTMDKSASLLCHCSLATAPTGARPMNVGDDASHAWPRAQQACQMCGSSTAVRKQSTVQNLSIAAKNMIVGLSASPG